MLASEIITKFEQYVDDTTELSTTEELALLNKIYQRVCMYRPWEFLKKSVTGTLSTSVPYVGLPTDFSYIINNNQYTDNSYPIDNNSAPKVVFVGTNYEPYKIINYSDRRQYRNQKGYAYVDIVNSRLYFTLQPTSADSYEFDYMSVPTTLVASDTPSIPTRFQDIIYHGMAVDDSIIQMFPKAQSYLGENQAMYDKYLAEMSYWNANLQNN